MTTFRVDAVTPAAEPLPTRPLGTHYPDALVLGGDPMTAVLEQDGVHPLLSAVGRAFADHRPLVLSPDAVWLTIAEGVARHIRLHAEELRPRLVDHTGRAVLAVAIDGPMPTDQVAWAEVVTLFDQALAAAARHSDLFECDFSTSTTVEQVAGRVVALDAYSEYFAMWLLCICGIPSITLTGTVEDWQRIRDRIDRIAGFGLETWCRSLWPIADQFVQAAAGKPDIEFWQRIYNPVDAYGGHAITGWITRLFPYLQGGSDGTYDFPNPMLELPVGEPRDITVERRGFYDGPGLASVTVPATLSRAVITVADSAESTCDVALRAGLVGVAQDADGALRPLPGWYLELAPPDIDEVIDRIIDEHTVTEPVPGTRLRDSAAADVLALYRRIGSASLFDGAWRILPLTEHRTIPVPGTYRSIRVMIELADGTGLGALDEIHLASNSMTTTWFRCRLDGSTETRACGTSLPHLLLDALDHDGRAPRTAPDPGTGLPG
ncbi:DUF4419 domain-containing protein [Nocardia sp. NPDC127579]|uniref:DUF4419 domain-containing protein n=1 Tax=Nocardia sp. NPDC127579 TaxID=3345402 RepID=UPI00363720EA